MLPVNRRWLIPASLIAAGALGTGILVASGPAGASSTTLVPSTTTATSTTIAAATAAVPAGRFRPVSRTAKVLSVSVHARPAGFRPATSARVVTVTVSATSSISAEATITSSTARTTETRRATARRSATRTVPLLTSRAAAVRLAQATAWRGARRLADAAASKAAWALAVAAVRQTVDGTASTLPTIKTSSVAPNSMPVGNLPGWRQVFADDFSTATNRGSFLSTYGRTWSAYPSPWKDTSGHGVYDPAKTLSTANGMLDIYLHTENGTHYVSAPEPKLPTMTYGRYSVRFQSDSLAGYKAAWLLWPNDNVWPAHGEIDYPEGDLNSNFSAFAHFASSGGGQYAFTQTARFSSWHTATMDWTPGRLVFYLDGQVVGTSTRLVPSTPMHWVLQTETALNAAAPSNSTAGHVRIDWVTAYAYAP